VSRRSLLHSSHSEGDSGAFHHDFFLLGSGRLVGLGDVLQSGAGGVTPASGSNVFTPLDLPVRPPRHDKPGPSPGHVHARANRATSIAPEAVWGVSRTARPSIREPTEAAEPTTAAIVAVE